MKTIYKILAFALAIFSANTFSTTQMKVGSWLSPSHVMNAIVLPAWGKRIAKATNGEVKLKIIYHQGHPKDVFGSVEDGVYDAGWSYHGYIPGRFKLTSIVEIPGLEVSAEAASVAHWRVHNKYLKRADEHDGLVLAALFTHGPGQIMMRKPIKSLADMRGKKIRVGGGIQGNIAKLMGVTPVPAPGSKVYEILSAGIADGIFMPVGEQKGLRLAEVAPFMFIYPGSGMYLGSFSIFLSPDFLDSISDKNRRAILSASGESLSRIAGRAWGQHDEKGYAASKEAGNTIHYATEAETREFKELTKNIESDWLENVKDRKVHAKAALKRLRSIARRY